MKTILSALVILSAVVGGAHAANTTDPFNDPSLALPRSENVDPLDDPRLALPRSEEYDPFNDPRQAVPFVEEVWPDISVAKP